MVSAGNGDVLLCWHNTDLINTDHTPATACKYNMQNIILVAGATGNLGERIVKALQQQQATVRVVVRANSHPEKVKALETTGAQVVTVNTWNKEELTAACAGVSCVVSALAGLQEVVLDAQQALLDAAVAAGVPRFIPSDYSLDFTPFSPGENRNLDWRRTFHSYLNRQPIAATSIFNGAFTELLTNEMPMIFHKQKLVLYWGKANHPWAFTTMNDTAAYTAKAALDPTTPRYLRIAGDLITPLQVRDAVTAVTGRRYRLFNPGGQKLLSLFIRLARMFAPAENELYPAWQGMQYMHNMIDERSVWPQTDNNRYPDLQWTSVQDVLAAHQQVQLAAL